jgi:hypothetical protein
VQKSPVPRNWGVTLVVRQLWPPSRVRMIATPPLT